MKKIDISRIIGKRGLKKCVVTAANDDGTYDIKTIGQDTSMKSIPNNSGIANLTVGDVTLLGYQEGSIQKPFIFGYISGSGLGSEIVILNPTTPPPAPVFGEPAIPYISPTGTKWGTLVNGASYRRLTEFPSYGDTIGMVTSVTYGIKWYGYEFHGTTQYVIVGTGYPQEWNILFSQNGTTHVMENQWDYISVQITNYVATDTDTSVKGYFDDFPLSGGFDSSAFNTFTQQYKDYYNNYW